MTKFLDIPCLPEEETRKVMEEIDKSIEAKKKEGLLTDREVREIEEMRLKPLSDILDVQGVYENHLYRSKY